VQARRKEPALSPRGRWRPQPPGSWASTPCTKVAAGLAFCRASTCGQLQARQPSTAHNTVNGAPRSMPLLRNGRAAGMIPAASLPSAPLHQSVRPLSPPPLVPRLPYPVTHRITDTRGQPSQLAWHRPTQRQHAGATARASPKSEGGRRPEPPGSRASPSRTKVAASVAFCRASTCGQLQTHQPDTAHNTMNGAPRSMPLLRIGRAGQHDTGGVTALLAPWIFPAICPAIVRAAVAQSS
jgi:hypothetical protein